MKLSKRTWMRSGACLGMAGILAASPLLSFPARADSPVILGETTWQEDDPEIYTAVDGHQISEEALTDSVVEYDELGSLIYNYNETIRQMRKGTDDTKQDYKEIRDYLRSEQASASRNRRKADDDGDVETSIEQSSLSAVYSSAAKSYNRMLKQMNRYSSNQSRISVERQLTNAAQSLMISWQSVELQKDYLAKMAELYQEQYENTLVSQSAGLATEQDVQDAYNRWQDAEVSLNSISDSTSSILQNLGNILGVDADEVEWKRIPRVDVSQVDTLDLEIDTQKAIDNNTDLISERSSSSDLTTGGQNRKNRAVAELEEKVKIEMQQLYENVMQAKQSYDAAQTGYKSAQLSWQNAQQKYQLGMLSKADYLLEEMSYVQKETAFQSEDLALLQALETYNWAVKGILTLE